MRMFMDQAPRETVSVAKLAKKFRGSAIAQVGNAASFAMGFAWRGAVLVTLDVGGLQAIAIEEHAATLWLVAVASAVVLVPLIVYLTSRQATLGKRAADAAQDGQHALAASLRAREMTYEALVGWGLAFVLATQFDGAVRATLPSEPAAWLFAYVAIVAVFCCAAACRLQRLCDEPLRPQEALEEVPASSPSPCSYGEGHGECDDAPLQQLSSRSKVRLEEPSLGQRLADHLLSGGALLCALASLDLSQALAGIDGARATLDLEFLLLYTAAAVSISALLMVLINSIDTKAAKEVLAPVARKHLQMSLGVSVGALRLRKFIGKTVVLSASLAVYALLYAVLAKHALAPTDARTISLQRPLPLRQALPLLGMATGAAVVGCALTDVAFKYVHGKLVSSNRSYVPGAVDDAALSAGLALAQQSLSFLIEALALLVGCALHALASSAHEELFVRHVGGHDGVPDGAGHDGATAAAFAYAVVTTLLAVLLANCLPPPPKSA